MNLSNKSHVALLGAVLLFTSSCTQVNPCEEYAKALRGRKYANVAACLQRVGEIAQLVKTPTMSGNSAFVSQLLMVTTDSALIVILHNPIYLSGRPDMWDTVLKSRPNGIAIEWPASRNSCVDTVWLISQPGRPIEE